MKGLELVTEKKKIIGVGLSTAKSNELSSKFLTSDFILEQVKDIENLIENDNDEIILISGEDLNLDLFKGEISGNPKKPLRPPT